MPVSLGTFFRRDRHFGAVIPGILAKTMPKHFAGQLCVNSNDFDAVSAKSRKIGGTKRKECGILEYIRKRHRKRELARKKKEHNLCNEE